MRVDPPMPMSSVLLPHTATVRVYVRDQNAPRGEGSPYVQTGASTSANTEEDRTISLLWTHSADERPMIAISKVQMIFSQSRTRKQTIAVYRVYVAGHRIYLSDRDTHVLYATVSRNLGRSGVSISSTATVSAMTVGRQSSV